MNDAIQFTSELVNLSRSKDLVVAMCVIGASAIAVSVLWHFLSRHNDGRTHNARTIIFLFGVFMIAVSFLFSSPFGTSTFGGATEGISEVSSEGDEYSLINSSVQKSLKSEGYAVVKSSDKPQSRVRIGDGDNTSFDVVKLDKNGNVPSSYDNPASCVVNPVSVKDDTSSFYSVMQSKATLTYTMKCESAETVKAGTTLKAPDHVFELGQE